MVSATWRANLGQDLYVQGWIRRNFVILRFNPVIATLDINVCKYTRVAVFLDLPRPGHNYAKIHGGILRRSLSSSTTV